MSKKIVLYVQKQGDQLLHVGDAGMIQKGDQVEWVSGGLDLKLQFPRSDIFGEPEYPMPPEEPTLTLTVKNAQAPSQHPEDYQILDVASQGYFPGGTAQDPRAQPVMIFGP
jgi:hypothetical protein